nr:cupin domain-containing protein [Sutcliffiella deserti]
MTLHDMEVWITKLDLKPHPEGGFYKQTFLSEERITDKELSVRFNGTRRLYSSIYFLLTDKNISHFHRLKSDEVWYYHGGSSFTVHVIHENGEYRKYKLGLNLEKGEVPQAIVPKNAIFGSTVEESDAFSLVGCMVSPGFEFEDFELLTQDDLLIQFPEHEDIIKKLAYEVLPA